MTADKQALYPSAPELFQDCAESSPCFAAEPALQSEPLEPPATQEGSDSAKWELCLGIIKAQLDPQIFAAYIKPMRLEGFDPSSATLRLSVPSRLILNHIEQNYRPTLERLANELFGIALTHANGAQSAGSALRFSVKIEVDAKRAELLQAQQQLQRTMKVQRPKPLPTPTNATPHANSAATGAQVTVRNVSSGREISGTVNPRYTFENFVVGNSNQFCNAAAMRCAEEPGRSYNPLFIYGGVGLGKTHLLHAIGNAVLQKRPNAKVLYLSSETFTNELIQALRRMERRP